jgi:TonB family protein
MEGTMRRIQPPAILFALAAAAAPSLAQPDTATVQVCLPTNPPQCMPRSRPGQFVPAQGQPYFEFMVTKPASEAQNTARPAYPPELKARGITGTVVAQFVVDTMGHVEAASFKLITVSHLPFGEAVREVVPGMRYNPAEVRGTKVRQLVQQPFVFAMAGQDPPALPAPAARQYPNPMAGTPAPAPPSGKVRGWSLTQRTTVDSGNGKPSITTTRLMGTGSIVRQETTFDAARGMSMVSLLDSANGTMTSIVPQMRAATRMRTPDLSGQQARPVRTSQPISTRIDTVPGSEPLLGMPTTRVKSEVVSRVTETLGPVTCTSVQRVSMEIWTVADSTVFAIQRRLAGSMSSTLGPAFEESHRAVQSQPTKPASALKVVTSGLAGGVTFSLEVLGFTLGEIDASLFAVPEGYTVSDMSGMQMPPMPDRSDFAARSFWQRNDTTRVGPDGSRPTCRPSNR